MMSWPDALAEPLTPLGPRIKVSPDRALVVERMPTGYQRCGPTEDGSAHLLA
ncbi:MAG: hypothetical protein JO025_11920 [Verrucomicrobia bacterium]|nr:hypothetical protein [Verrucomicrobiota bacterium]